MLTAHDPADEAARGGELHWRERADGHWLAPLPLGSGHYELVPEERGFRLWKHEAGMRPKDLGHRATLGGGMAAAKDDVNAPERHAAEGGSCGCPHSHPPEVPSLPCAGEGEDRAERMYAFIVEQLDAGRTVYLSTATRHTKITKRHLAQVRVRKNRLEIQHGKRWLDYTHTRLSASESSKRPAAFEATAKDSAPYERNTRDPHEVEAGRAMGVLDTPRRVYDALRARLSKESQEVFLVIPLDLRMQALSPPVEVARGQRDQVEIDPSDVYRPVIRHNAKCFVVVHCHPSGNAQPSPADQNLTASLRRGSPKALGKKGGRFIDHVIVASSATRGEYYSFAEGQKHAVRH